MRDFLLAVEPVKTMPATVSLRTRMPPVYDRGQLGSCTANSKLGRPHGYFWIPPVTSPAAALLATSG
jgi:hypothetical protein